MKTYRQFVEEAPVNNVGGGHIAGVGIGNENKPANWGEPGMLKNRKRKHKILRRKKPNG
jgi:hypothetical protein